MVGSEVVRALGALAQESRLEIYRQLVQAGPQGLPAGEIRDRVGIPGTTLSFHLSQLSNAGLIRSTREGRSLIYAVDFGAMQSLLGFLTENCCQGSCDPPAPIRIQKTRKRGRARVERVERGAVDEWDDGGARTCEGEGPELLRAVLLQRDGNGGPARGEGDGRPRGRR